MNPVSLLPHLVYSLSLEFINLLRGVLKQILILCCSVHYDLGIR